MGMEPEQIIRTVCENLSLDRDKLLSPFKRSDYIDGRFIAIALIREYNPDLAHKKVARLFNRVQHGSSINACKKCKNFLETNADGFRRKFEMIKSQLQILRHGERKAI